jgi:hypothetical protein
MTNSIFTHMLKETSQSLNMTQRHLKADTKRLAEYWEVALEQGNVDDINIAILFLDAGIHGYLKAKGLDLGNRKTLKKGQSILNYMILLIGIYALDQPKELFPKVQELTPMIEKEVLDVRRGVNVLELAERILREKRDHNV